MKTMGWEQRLADYLSAVHAGQAGFGSYDCVAFAARWVEIALGIEIRHPLLKTGITEEESLSALKLKSLQAWVSEVMGAPRSARFARRGDLVLRSQAGRDALGVCDGENAHFLLEGRTGACPTLICDLSWEVD